MRKTFRESHLDYTEFNPNLYSKEPDVEPFENLKARVVDLCKAWSGNGIRGLRIMFKAMDWNGDKSLDPTEFKYAMWDYGLKISDAEVTAIVKYFDRDWNGKISFDEFLRALRGDLNARWLDMVSQAFKVLDKTGDGVVTIKDILMAYDCS